MIISLKAWTAAIAYISFVSSTAPTNYVPTVKKPGMPYSFSYGVKDGYRGTDFGQTEHSDGNLVTGMYSVQLPDGRKQTVTYKADHLKGYVADVSYIGEAQYPPPSKIPPFIVKHNVGVQKTSKHLASTDLSPLLGPENRELFSDKELPIDSHISSQIFLEGKGHSAAKPVSIPQIKETSLPKHQSIHLQLSPQQKIMHSKVIPKPQLIIKDIDTGKRIHGAKKFFLQDDRNTGRISGEKYLSDMEHDSERARHIFDEGNSLQMLSKHDEEDEEDDNDARHRSHGAKFSNKFQGDINSDEDEDEKHLSANDDDERKGKSFARESEHGLQRIRHQFPFPYSLRSDTENFYHPRYVQYPVPSTQSIYRLLGSAYRPHPVLPLNVLGHRNRFRTLPDSGEQLGKHFLIPAYHHPQHHLPLGQTQILKAHLKDLTSKFESSNDYRHGAEFDIAKQDVHKSPIVKHNELPNSPVYIPNDSKSLGYQIKPSFQTLGNFEGHGRPLDIL